MDLEILAVLGLICWWAIIPALVAGLRLRRAAEAERVTASAASIRLPCERRTRTTAVSRRCASRFT